MTPISMQTTPAPEILSLELKAVRDFLAGETDELVLPPTRAEARPVKAAPAMPTVRQGIPRARTRSARAAV